MSMSPYEGEINTGLYLFMDKKVKVKEQDQNRPTSLEPR